ncbi:hypothetical protein [Sphingomonas sp. CLY1604]|uniref:hypothetical protein n=1 Tax=Sphingomonas sp. CLY1604 TaxID=3457786 RepID=UPI003FD6D15D
MHVGIGTQRSPPERPHLLFPDQIDRMLHMAGGHAQALGIDEEERFVQAGQCFFTSCRHRSILSPIPGFHLVFRGDTRPAARNPIE